MLQLARDEPGAQALVLEIVDRAEGVFLWVKLVVISLLNGLGNFDHISDLRNRLSILPAMLKDLYKYMLDHIDPIYSDEDSRIFQIFRAAKAQVGSNAEGNSPVPLTTLELTFAIERGSELPLSAKIIQLSSSEILARCEMMDNNLGTRCGGLLETHRD